MYLGTNILNIKLDTILEDVNIDTSSIFGPAMFLVHVATFRTNCLPSVVRFSVQVLVFNIVTALTGTD
jgi:hypothetical protein